MAPFRNHTRFTGATPLRALLILAATMAAIAWCLLRYDAELPTAHPNRLESDLSDAALYGSVARQVQDGRNYYDAAANELVSRGYQTGSIFNWRLPVYAWLFGAPTGPRVAYALLIALLIVSAAAAITAAPVERLGRTTAAVGLIGAYGWLSHPYPGYFTEIWSGLLIFLSATAFGAGRGGLGIVTAAAALAFRELALPYIGVVAAMAMRRRNRRELVALILLSLSFILLFTVHYRIVRSHAPVAVSAAYIQWIKYGGTPFILSTCRMNYLLAQLHPQYTAVFLPLALLGLGGCRVPAAGVFVATTVTYLVLFAFTGRPVNYYWGWMIVPLLWIGFVHMPYALVDLITALTTCDRRQGQGAGRE